MGSPWSARVMDKIVRLGVTKETKRAYYVCGHPARRRVMDLDAIVRTTLLLLWAYGAWIVAQATGILP